MTVFANFQLKKVHFHHRFSLKCDKIYTEWPSILESLHQKRPTFVGSHTNDPLFSTKSYIECPLPQDIQQTLPSVLIRNAYNITCCISGLSSKKVTNKLYENRCKRLCISYAHVRKATLAKLTSVVVSDLAKCPSQEVELWPIFQS